CRDDDRLASRLRLRPTRRPLHGPRSLLRERDDPPGRPAARAERRRDRAVGGLLPARPEAARARPRPDQAPAMTDHDPRDRGFNGGHARHHDLAQGRDPWERQPHESGKAYACFTLYREMGPITRTLRAVAQETKRDLSLVNRWSSSWQWVFRAEQWDQREAELRAQTLRGQYEAMIKRHRALASAGLALVIQRVVGDPSKGIE